MKKIQILYEDSYLLIINKPSGILSSPLPNKRSKDIISCLKSSCQKESNQKNFYLCHRLDYEVSGILIIAKSKNIQEAVMAIFKKRKIKKIYIAFVQGVPKNRKGQIHYKIEGKSASTNYEIKKSVDIFSVVIINPVTGRKNQIRIHLKKIGHPVVGDRRFSIAKRYPVKFKRTALHAGRIEFMHPITNKRVVCKSSLPSDMADFLTMNNVSFKALY